MIRLLNRQYKYFYEILNVQASRALGILAQQGDTELMVYASHRMDHAMEVLKNTNKVMDTLDEPQGSRSRYIAQVAALCHDLGMANGLASYRHWQGFAPTGAQLRSNHAIVSGLEVLSRASWLRHNFKLRQSEVYLVALVAMSHSKSNSTLAHFEFRAEKGFCPKDEDFSTFIAKANKMGEDFSTGIGRKTNVFSAKKAEALLRQPQFAAEFTKVSYCVSIADSMAHSRESTDRDSTQGGCTLGVELTAERNDGFYSIVETAADNGKNIVEFRDGNATAVNAAVNGSKVINPFTLAVYAGEKVCSFEPIKTTEELSTFQFVCPNADKYPSACMAYILERVGETLRYPYGKSRLQFEIRIPFNQENAESIKAAKAVVFGFFCAKDVRSGLGRIMTFNQEADKFRYNGGLVPSKQRVLYTFCDMEGNEIPHLDFC